MKTYIIIFSKNFNSVNYSNVTNYLKTASLWAKPFDNVWIIKANKKVSEIRDDLKKKMLGSDEIFVLEIEIGKNWATSSIDKKVTDWMKTNI